MNAVKIANKSLLFRHSLLHSRLKPHSRVNTQQHQTSVRQHNYSVPSAKQSAGDCGANALLPLVSLPHCGAVVTRDQPERVDRLISRLTAEVSARQQRFAV